MKTNTSAQPTTNATTAPMNWAGSVVVGYDGSSHADLAITWAARVAQTRGCPLVLLSAAKPLVSMHDGAALFDAGLIEGETIYLRGVLRRKVDAVRDEHPELDVVGQFLVAGPALSLIEASATADLVVLGSRRLHGLAVCVLGGVSDPVVTHAQGPIAVVPEGGQGPRTGPVVVGVESRATPDHVLTFAAERARTSGRDLVLLHAWDVRVPWRFDLLADAERTREINLAWEEEMRDIVDQLQERFPDVEMRTEVQSGSAVDALVDLSARAALLVVGTRGRGGFTGLLLGSTSRRVLQLTNCPAIVVPTPHMSR